VGRFQVPEGQLLFSASQMKTWMMCPRKYELRYVRGLPPAFVPVALAFGTAFHAAVGRYFAGVQSKNAPPALDVIAQSFRDAWQAQVDGKVPLQADEDEDLDAMIDLGVKMLGAFHAHMAGRDVSVEAIEHPFVVGLHDPDTGEVLEEQLAGFMDVVVRESDRRVIIELKTSARKYTQDQIDFDLQPSAYKFAADELGWGDAGIRFLVVTKTKTPAVQEEELLRGPMARADFLRTAVGVLRAIDAGVSYPVRGWQCRSCPFKAACETLGGAS
jgi:CRISPR/Cas system-associated exonuclease Cas4 (RecB family)